MMRLVLIGAGGHGKVVADAAEAAGWTQIVFLDRAWPERVKNGAWNIVGTTDDPDTPHNILDTSMFLSIGSNTVRERYWASLHLHNSPTIVHPSAVVSRHALLEPGVFVAAGVVVNAGAVVRRGSILNTGCSVDHDCSLEPFVHISPGARLAGGVQIGTRSWVGIGASIREGIIIGIDVVVGAGAAVTRNVKDGRTATGVPASPRLPQTPEALPC